MMLYISNKFHENISKDSELWSGHDFHSKYLKGHNFVKNVGRVTNLVLCTLSDNTLYL